MRLYLDTHILVWLYQDAGARLTPRGTTAIETAEHILISPIVELELSSPFEIKRITQPATTILDTLRRDLGLETCQIPFASVVGSALDQTWTRDPFDRLIEAQAAHGDNCLLTADSNILKHYALALW